MKDYSENKVLKTIEKFNLIEEKDKIVLGVSGGPDSICMLDILYKIKKELKFEIVVAHINHQIRKEAKEDEEYVKDFCKKRNIEFYSKSIDVQKLANNSKIGLEEAGRKVRYNFFDEILEKTNANKVAIAHNKNDVVETVFMNILRGSGIKGLRGIDVKRDKYIRPIIECERIEIEEYCKKHELEPKIDKTNSDNTYTRNKIRNVVIPYIQKEFNPNIIESVEKLSNLVKEEDMYIEKQTQEIFINLLISKKEKEIVLNLKTFNTQEKVIKARIILYTITSIFGSANRY